MSKQPQPKYGQVWREIDPRQERHVRIEHVGSTHATVRKVIRYGNRREWVDAPRSRAGYAHLPRFNGKRGGYEFVEQIEGTA